MTREELAIVLEKHRMWLNDENGGERADLRYADLRSANLLYADLRSADLRYANLVSADLVSAKLVYADLRSANLRYADLRYADLRYADLRSANLLYADLRYADLRYANLVSADLRSATGEMKHLKSIFLDTWPITYTADVLQIGCQQHHFEKWKSFTDEEIAKMDSKALDWWNKYKTIIMQRIELSPAQPTGYKE